MQTPPTDLESSLLSVRNLGVSNVAGQSLFQNLNFTLNAGEVLWVKGPRGSGKTTLLRLLGGTQLATQGDIEWLVEPEEIGFIPEPQTLRFFSRVTFADLIERETGDRAQAENCFTLGILDRESLALVWNEASREHRARLLVTLALLRQPRLLILDEPFLNLDQATARDLGQSLAIHLLENHPQAIVVVSAEPLKALDGCGVSVRTVSLGAEC